MSNGTAWVALAAALSLGAQRVAAQQIPLVEGLTIVTAIRDDRGDYEGLRTLRTLGPDVVDFSLNWDLPDASAPGGSRRLHADRAVRRSDLAKAHRVNAIYSPSDPPLFPGATAIQTSTEVLEELKTKGSTAFVFGMVLPHGGVAQLLGGMLDARKYFRGTLTRVAGPATFPVLVNGVRRQLPVVRASGHVSVGTDGGDVEFVFLDDPLNPLTLRWNFGGWKVQIISIAWEVAPDAGAGKASAGAAAELATQCRTEVHGIYFAFGSPAVQPESEPALSTIAVMLRANPSWVVTIEGHTDSVGAAKANLDLSRLRVDAVRNALETRYGIAPARLSTAGFGASRPIESNATLEGRARNRRVELSRKC